MTCRRKFRQTEVGKLERLDKLLAGTGRWSRKEVRQLVRDGRVSVDGVCAARPEEKYDRESVLCVDGAPVNAPRFTYLLMNKPAGLLSATEDRGGRTVLDLLPPELKKRGLFPAGRLDKDTEGLLLLTNDGALAHRLLSPKSHVDKVYRARVSRPVPPDAPARFQAGLRLADGMVCLPAELTVSEDGLECLVTVREGKFHQVKRMLSECGAPVIGLRRVKMGGLALDPELSSGAWRELTEAELTALSAKTREFP